MLTVGLEIAKLRFYLGLYKGHENWIYLFWVQKSVKVLGIPVYRKNIKSLPLSEEAMIEFLKAYQAHIKHLRAISKPRKRFTLAAVEKVEIDDLQQEGQEKAYIEKQAQLFEACKEKLVEEYEDNYVLFEDGTILDSGKTRVELAMRAYQKHGMKPLFIERVVSKPESLAAVWTPFPLTK